MFDVSVIKSNEFFVLKSSTKKSDSVVSHSLVLNTEDCWRILKNWLVLNFCAKSIWNSLSSVSSKTGFGIKSNLFCLFIQLAFVKKKFKCF